MNVCIYLLKKTYKISKNMNYSRNVYANIHVVKLSLDNFAHPPKLYKDLKDFLLNFSLTPDAQHEGALGPPSQAPRHPARPAPPVLPAPHPPHPHLPPPIPDHVPTWELPSVWKGLYCFDNWYFVKILILL